MVVFSGGTLVVRYSMVVPSMGYELKSFGSTWIIAVCVVSFYNKIALLALTTTHHILRRTRTDTRRSSRTYLRSFLLIGLVEFAV